MGKSSLLLPSIAIVLLSLISVDSTNSIQQIDSHEIYHSSISIIQLKYINSSHSCKFKLFNQIKNRFQLNQNPVWLKAANILVHLIIFVYCCLSIGCLCDKHFVPSLESLGKTFSLSPALTSAILIPLGTSGPEIFSSVVGVFFADNDIGTGSIIGSSIYNLLTIPAACGFAATYFFRESIPIPSETILKDLGLYIITVIGLIFTVKDQNVDLFESLLLMVLFCVYIGIKVISEPESSIENEEIELKDKNSNQNVDYNCFDDDNDSETDEGIMNNKFINAISIPILSLFQLTIPKPQTNSVLSFLSSIIWLSALSYQSVESITVVSESLSIPSSIAGMTILAAGSAVPDLVTSVIIMKKNLSSSNGSGIGTAIASNNIAILFGLGFPWLLKCIINYFTENKMSFAIESESLPITCSLLLLAIFSMAFALKQSDYQIGIKLSVFCLIIQVIFTIISIAIEF